MPVTILIYSIWQICFTVIVSPLVLHALTAEQMGFSIGTAVMGLIGGVVATIILGLLSSQTTIGLRMHIRGFKGVRTREAFEEMWRIQLYGCYDGVIAEPHWSGAVLPLLIVGFSLTGISFPLSVIPAILTRWLLHVGVHVLLPRGMGGGSAVGSLDFVAVGLLFLDVTSSLCLLTTGSIVAPIIVHTFSAPFSQLLGNKKRIAKKMGISLD